MNAFDEIYKLYAKEVYLFLLQLSKNQDIAEDLTQTTFLKAIEKLGTFKKQCKVSTWLCQIAKNEYLNYIQKKEYQNLPLDQVQEPWKDDVEEQVLLREHSREIYKILHSMEEPYKEIFMLRVFGELSFKEIGELFQKTDLWARVTYRRAKEKIKNKLM